jgi:hypothetical protein
MSRLAVVPWAEYYRRSTLAGMLPRERPDASNENKMSDGGRDRALVGVELWKSSQKWRAQRSAVRSIARLCEKYFRFPMMML